MTYAGLKSMIYAGLTQDDPRVKAAIGYIKDHYTLDENPGQGQRGLYYYYHTFAKAMALLGQPTLVDGQGQGARLAGRARGGPGQTQDPNGGWVNRDDRFMEGDPNIVTSFAMLALAAARRRLLMIEREIAAQFRDGPRRVSGPRPPPELPVEPAHESGYGTIRPFRPGQGQVPIRAAG